MIDFIGIGAQKSGTSWIYACLYEHPEICAPVKEIHFFSRDRFGKGREWYESHFRKCKDGTRSGEFSTSYLYSKEAASRIKMLYPDTKIIAVLRNPKTRAYSQYQNAQKAGEIGEDVSFEAYVESEPSALEQGRYMEQLDRYLRLFRREHVLVLIYEDIERDPRAFMQTIYRFLGVDENVIPSMLHARINTARMPRFVRIDRWMHHVSEFLRTHGLDRFVYFVRKSRLPDIVRVFNTKQKGEKEVVDGSYFRDDIERLSTFLGRDLIKEWNI
jgi:hypothetical protein